MTIKTGQVWTPKSKDRPDMTVVEVLENVVAVIYTIHQTFTSHDQLNWIKKDWLLEDWELKK